MPYNVTMPGSSAQSFASMGPRLASNISAWQQQRQMDEMLRQFQAAMAAQQAGPNGAAADPSSAGLIDFGTGDPIDPPAAAPGSGANQVFGSGIDLNTFLGNFAKQQGGGGGGGLGTLLKVKSL